MPLAQWVIRRGKMPLNVYDDLSGPVQFFGMLHGNPKSFTDWKAKWWNFRFNWDGHREGKWSGRIRRKWAQLAYNFTTMKLFRKM